MATREIKGRYERTFSVERSAINQEARTVELALSSETPYERWYGTEILGHGPGEVDLSRLLNSAALLMDHNMRDQIGVVESARLDPDRVLRCVVRFGKSARAEEIWQDVLDGIRTKVSVGYDTTDYVMTKGANGAPDSYRFTNWMPYEASIVSVPADDAVGIGRSANPGDTPEPPTTLPASGAGQQEVRMPETPNTPAAPAAPAPSAPEVRELTPEQVLNILDQAQRLGVTDKVRKAMGEGAKEEQLRKIMLDEMVARGGKPLGDQPPQSGMNEKEEREYSIARAILLAATGTNGLEREVSQDLAKRLGRETNGIFIPTAVKLRALDAAVTATAAGLVSQQPVTFIELLRAKARLLQMGATYLPGMVGVVPFARQITGGSATWTGDNPASAVSNSDPTLETFSMSPKQLMAQRQYSKQLLVQTSGYADNYVTADLASAHALEVDRCGVHGLGSSNQPRGILNFSGIGSVAVGTNGGAPTWDTVVDLETALANANADDGNMGYLTNTKVRGKLKKTLESAVAGSTWIWNKDNTINGYKAMATNQVASNLTKGSGTNLSAILFGAWQELLVLEWGALEIITDPYSLADKGLIRVISTQLVDINLRHVQSFAACVDAQA
jgi:HK97 family phage major capsid protein